MRNEWKSHFTVMGPDRAFSTPAGITHNALTFNCVTKNNMECRDALNKWVYVICTTAKLNKKFAGTLDNLAVLIYMICDRAARGL